MIRAGRVVTYAAASAVWGADCREEVEYLRTSCVSCARDRGRSVEAGVPAHDVYVGYRFADAQLFQDEPLAGTPITEAGTPTPSVS